MLPLSRIHLDSCCCVVWIGSLIIQHSLTVPEHLHSQVCWCAFCNAAKSVIYHSSPPSVYSCTQLTAVLPDVFSPQGLSTSLSLSHTRSYMPTPKRMYTIFPVLYFIISLFLFVPLCAQVASCSWHLQHLDKPVVVHICIQDHLYPCQPSFTAWMS